MVFIGHDGKVKVERGLIRREDMRKAASSGSDGAGEGMEEGEAIKQKPIHSERLTRMLTAHRTAAMQASIANRADVALAAIVSQLAERLFADYRSRSRVVVQILAPARALLSFWLFLSANYQILGPCIQKYRRF